MDLIEAFAALETNHDLHCARLLVLLDAFAGSDGTEVIEGLTKLAKLDFLLRYPVMLERALVARNRSPKDVKVAPYERNSVESRMVRYRFGPWDHRYREFLNILVGKGLAQVSVEGRKVTVGITAPGRQLARTASGTEGFADIARRAGLLKAGMDMAATNLMRFIYDTFPELASLKMNEEISL